MERELRTIFFVVEYTCFNPQGVARILDALSKAAKYQIDNAITGVLTYHFSRPSTEEPERLRFIEFYSSEDAFWKHSMNPVVGNDLMVTFDPQIRKSFSWWAIYSNEIEKRVKDTVRTLGGCEVSPVQGHVNLNYKSRFGGEPVLLVAKCSKTQDHLQGFLEENKRSFFESTKYHFGFNDPTGDFHMISLWPNQHDMIDSLNQLRLPETEMRPQLYLGNETPREQLKKIFAPWKPEYRTKPEAGYSLHPKCLLADRCTGEEREW